MRMVVMPAGNQPVLGDAMLHGVSNQQTGAILSRIGMYYAGKYFASALGARLMLKLAGYKHGWRYQYCVLEVIIWCEMSV